MKGNAKVIPMAGIDDLVDALTNDSIDGGWTFFMLMQISTRRWLLQPRMLDTREFLGRRVRVCTVSKPIIRVQILRKCSAFRYPGKCLKPILLTIFKTFSFSSVDINRE